MEALKNCSELMFNGSVAKLRSLRQGCKQHRVSQRRKLNSCPFSPDAGLD